MLDVSTNYKANVVSLENRGKTGSLYTTVFLLLQHCLLEAWNSSLAREVDFRLPARFSLQLRLSTRKRVQGSRRRAGGSATNLLTLKKTKLSLKLRASCFDTIVQPSTKRHRKWPTEQRTHDGVC